MVGEVFTDGGGGGDVAAHFFDDVVDDGVGGGAFLAEAGEDFGEGVGGEGEGDGVAGAVAFVEGADVDGIGGPLGAGEE